MRDLLSGTAIPLPAGLDRVRARFAAVDTWVFDLDNTLYPHDSDLWPQIDARISQYLANFLGIDGLSARALQKFYYRRYGTTLHGLMADHAMDHVPFLDFVHDIDRTNLAPNPRLAQAVARLPGRKLVLTNGSRDHALRTVERLGFGTAFEDVFDIVAADLTPKPAPATYHRFFERHAVDPTRSAMVEDLSRNLIVPHQRGMATVLVVPKTAEADARDPWERAGVTDPHVDFVTDDLTGFLVGLLPGVAP